MALTSPICLITGATQGIGRALVEAALAGGATVVAMGTTGITASGLVYERDIDIRSSEAVAGFLADPPVDRLDILVNNAGVFPDPDVGLQELSIREMLNALDINVVGAARVTRACLPFLRRSASPTILNISSNMGSLSRVSNPGSYGYRMSKAALNMFTVALAREFPSFRTLSVHPGWVQTQMGGPEAPLDPATSAQDIWKLATNPPTEGLFHDYRGEPMEW